MGALQRFCAVIDQFTDVVGKLASWLSLLLVVVTCAVVVLRYFLGGGSIALQESMTYIHASLFMLTIAYTLKQGGHVRVDVFYSRFSARKQALVDVIGTLVFLLPVSLLIAFMSWTYVGNSWAIQETSTESAGIPFVYLLKSLLIILPTLLVMQGLSECIKSLLFFLGKGGSHNPAKVEAL